MRDWLTSVGDGIGRLRRGLRRALPDVSLTRPAPVTVYLVHDGPGAEDYAILIDFHAFMAESQRGLFVRPVLSVWAGRRDFERHVFARRLRESFAAEFDRLYGVLAEEIVAERRAKAERGWFGLGTPALGAGLGVALGAGWLATLVLWLALSTGRAAWGEAGRIVRAALRLRSGEVRRAAELEARLAEKRAVVDAALREIGIRLHRELWEHAWAGQAPGPLTGIDRDAWPLPAEVRAHMRRREAPGALARAFGWW
ncbi:MAG: hypothetical protein AAFV86_19410 [Pseudomonadota bacterium]